MGIRHALGRIAAAALLFATGACASIERLAVPGSALDAPVWQQHQRGSQATVDHSAWDSILAQRVAPDAAGINRVDYAGVTDAERVALNAYLERLQQVDVAALDRDEQLAFWINLYNAQTVATVLEAYPVESIRQIKPSILAIGPWDIKLVEVAGRPLSLNDIEHGIVRPVFKDHRIHYALNCAAAGCPNLKLDAWRGATLEADLAAAERAYVNDPRGVRFEGDRLVLSSIYSWFREDFAEDEAGVIASLVPLVEGETGQRLAERQSVNAYAYDWALNEQGAELVAAAPAD